MALAVFSLKRNRSGSSSSKLYENNYEPVNKLSRLFNKFTSSLLYHKQHQHQQPIRRASIKKLNVIFKNDKEPKIPTLNLLKEEEQQPEYQRYSQHSDIVFSKKEKLEYDPRYLSTVQISKNGLPSILIRRPSSLSDMKSTTTTTVQHQKVDNDEERKKKKKTSTLTLNEDDIHHQLQQHYLTITSSSNMTTCSGDLSAKEFADITGIKIISEDDDNDDDYSEEEEEDNNEDKDSEWLFDHHHHHRISSHISSRNHSFLDEHDKLSMHTSSSSIYSGRHHHHHHKRHLPHIWDAEFWQEPISFSLKQQQLQKEEEEKEKENKEDIPNILYELRKMNTTSNECLNKNNNPLRKHQSCVIKKGRFEVSLETTDTT